MASGRRNKYKSFLGRDWMIQVCNFGCKSDRRLCPRVRASLEHIPFGRLVFLVESVALGCRVNSKPQTLKHRSSSGIHVAGL